MTKAEEKIREKARKLVKNKVQAKFKGFEMSEKDVNELEVELLEDLEETIQEHLEAYKDTLKHEHHQSDEGQMLLQVMVLQEVVQAGRTMWAFLFLYCWGMFQLYVLRVRIKKKLNTFVTFMISQPG